MTGITPFLAETGFGTIDLVIVIVYLVGIMVVGILAGYRRHASSEQFFLAGKSLRWPMIGAALFTANISTIHLVGLSASGFSEGIVIGNFEWPGIADHNVSFSGLGPPSARAIASQF